MDRKLDAKINIGISACQIGSKIKDDYKGWDMPGYLKREKDMFNWHPVCLEVMSGLGVSRNFVRLAKGNGGDFWDRNTDVKNSDEEILNYEIKSGMSICLDFLKSVNADVFIYMEGSPSCGVHRTTLKDRGIEKPFDIFSSLLLKEKIFIIPALDLQSPLKWWDWRRRMYAYVWLKNKNFSKPSEIYKIWHILKFLVQEINRKKADEIGKKLAVIKDFSETEKQEIKDQILSLLREPSTTEKIKNMLWKNYKHLYKKYGLSLENIMEPNEERNIIHIVEEILELEKKDELEELFFGSSPIKNF